MKKLLLMLALLLLPFALADISITCSPSSVQPGEAVNCNAATTTTLNNVGRLSFTVNPGTLFEITSTSGLAGVTFNPANGIGTYTNAQGINFNANAVLFTINLRAKTGVQGSESISFSRFIVRDTTPVDINFGTVRNSNMITVGSAGRACSEADWCGPWGTCPAGTQTRTCNTPAGAACTSGVTAEPAETQSCTPSCAGVADGAACTLSGASGTCQNSVCQPTASGNNPPIAEDDTFTVVLGAGAGSLETTFNVLTNDRDPDNDALRITSTTQPANGLVSLPSNRRISYRSNAGFTGTDSFTYTISDGRGGTATATVTVTVSSSLTCTFRAATCSQAGVSCPYGTSGAAVPVNRVVCSPPTPNCNPTTGGCQAAVPGSSVCGDGSVSSNEQCDDGNTADGDGCSSRCLCDSNREFVGGKCSLVLQEIRTELNNAAEPMMSRVARIFRSLRCFFLNVDCS